MEPKPVADAHPQPLESRADGWVEPELLTTQEEIAFRLQSIQEQCQESVDILVKGQPSDTSADALEKILNRGIPIHCIYERAAVDTPEGNEHVARWARLGEQQKVVDSVPFRAAVFDRSTVLIPITSERGAITSILAISSGLGVGVAYLFDLLWQSEPLEKPLGPGPSISGEGLAVLKLMCEGMSDQKIAKQLGMGVRTVQRRIGELSTLFGAVSRPALAARAVMVGVVTPWSGSQSMEVHGDESDDA